MAYALCGPHGGLCVQEKVMNLLLFMTYGMSLAKWAESGSLHRELALYEHLNEHGVAVGIVSYGGKEDLEIAEAYPGLAVYVNRFSWPLDMYARRIPFFHASALLWADIIKSNQTSGAEIALRCARIWNKPFIARCGYMWSDYAKNAKLQNVDDIVRLETEVFCAANHVCVTTVGMKQDILERVGLSETSVSVIPNYIPSYFYDSLIGGVAQSPKPVICQVGRLSAIKNIYSLVEACATLPVALKLIGSGEEKDGILARSQELGVDMRITEAVQHASLPQELARATICTLVSHYEGHPKALIEYMAQGCAILAANSPGISSIIRHEENGLLCSTDSASIAAGVKRLLEDSDLRERLGRQAKQDAQLFSLNSVARLEINLYKQISRNNSYIHSLFYASKFIVNAVTRKLLKKIKVAVERYRYLLVHLRSLSRGNSPVLNNDTSQYIENSAREGSLQEINVEELFHEVEAHCARLSPSEALRFVFALDQRLYSLSGGLSVAYDDGVHTKHRHTRYHDFFVSRIKSGATVLDIGCGNGFLAHDIAKKSGAQVTGIDLNQGSIDVARQRFSHENVKFVCGDVLKDLPTNRYDVVVLSNVLEHLPERVAFLRKVQSVIHPSKYLIRVPLFERDWRVPLKQELGVEWRLDITHEIEYTQEEFLDEVASANLRLTHFEIRWSEIWCEAVPTDNLGDSV